MTDYKTSSSDSDSELWAKMLKDKCDDCYELNRYREVRSARSAPFLDGWIIEPRYCPKHQKQIDELRALISKSKRQDR